MSKKRGAETGLSSLAEGEGQKVYNKDNGEEESEKVTLASADVLAKRTIVTAKRRNASATAQPAAAPAAAALAEKKEQATVEAPAEVNSFAKFMTQPRLLGSNKLSLEEDAEASVEAPAAGVNPFAKFMTQPNQWQCGACKTNNEKTLDKCRVCEAGKPAEKKEEKKEEKTEEKKEEKEKETVAAPAGPNPFAKFMTQPNQWQCAACKTNNDKSLDQCRACEAACPAEKKGEKKEEKQEEKKEEKASGGAVFQFTSSSTNPFTFSSAASSSATPFSGFAASSSSTSSPFSFTAAPFTGFSSTSSVFSSSGSSPFAFTSPLSTSAGGATAGDADEDGDAEAPPKETFTKVIHPLFQEAKAVDSGDSSDKVEYSLKDVKVFQLLPVTRPSKDGKVETKIDWVDSGKGEVYVNTFTAEDGKLRARIVSRREKTFQLIVNAPIFAGMKFDLMNAKNLRVFTVGRAETEEKNADGSAVVKDNANVTYLFRVTGRGDTAQALFDAVTRVQKQLGEAK